MTRHILIALCLAALAPATALADEPPGTPAPAPGPAAGAPAPAPAPVVSPADLEKAKKAFGEAKKSFDAGDFPEAIAKFKEAYNLSKKPELLYNIGIANESAGQADIALFYYRKFLTDAPQDNPQRPEAEAKVKAIQAQFAVGPTGPAKPDLGPKDGPRNKTIKPPGTYGASDFQHQIIDTAPPAKPLDITASVPDDSGFVVTLYFRTAGEGKFTSKEMHWRYRELVGRIPAPKMIGTSVQYYIEAKDTKGDIVARSGKSTSPNLVNLDPGSEARFYPDMDEQGERQQTTQEVLSNDLEEDPLHKGHTKPRIEPKHDVIVEAPKPVGPRDGFFDPGSKKHEIVKWSATGGAVVMVGLAITFNVLAHKQASGIEDDSTGCGGPPCQKFDSYDGDIEKAGKRDQKISNVTLGFGIGFAVIAGIYWYRDLRADHSEHEATPPAKMTARKRSSGEQASWLVVPTVNNDQTTGFSAGAAASLRF